MDDPESWMQNIKVVTTRVPHNCHYCSRLIKPGERASRLKFFQGDEDYLMDASPWVSHYQCTDCAKDEFGDD